MKEDRLALAKAADSGDTDLSMCSNACLPVASELIWTRSVYQVLLHLHKRLPLGSFFRLIEDGGPSLTPASRLLEVYAREQNREMLRDFYYSDDRRVESAVLCLEEAAAFKVRYSVLNPSRSLVNLPLSCIGSSSDRNSSQKCAQILLRGQGSDI